MEWRVFWIELENYSCFEESGIRSGDEGVDVIYRNCYGF